MLQAKFFRYGQPGRLDGRGQLSSEQPEKCFGRQRDEPGGVIASMRNNPWFTTAIAFGLSASIDKIEFLDSFDFEVKPRQGDADHVRAPGTPRELLAATRVKPFRAAQCRKFPLAHLSFHS